MSARPLFDIPEGWQILTKGEIILKTDEPFGKWRKYVFNPEVFCEGSARAGETITENDDCWYFRRIEPKTPAVDAEALASSLVDVLSAENAALTSRVSLLEGALGDLLGRAERELADPVDVWEVQNAKAVLDSAKRGPSAGKGAV